MAVYTDAAIPTSNVLRWQHIALIHGPYKYLWSMAPTNRKIVWSGQFEIADCDGS